MDSFDQLADFYDLDYPDTSDHAFLRHLVGVLDPGHLLEIPCGSGRNVMPLLSAAKRRVTFMDLAPAMAARAGERIPPDQRDRARAVPGDLRSVGPEGPFDLVICPREAFQLLSRSDAGQALRSMAGQLTSEGLIVIDIFTFSSRPCGPAGAPPDYFTPGLRDWADDWTRTMSDGSSLTRRRRHSQSADGVRFEMRYTILGAGLAGPRQLSLEFDMANYGYAEFGELARQSGLDVLATADSYAGGVTTAPRSPRMVFVLGHDRGQQDAERLDRIREAVTAGGPVT